MKIFEQALVFLMLGPMTAVVSLAQVPPAPICPTGAGNVVFIATPPAPAFPINSNVSVSIGIRFNSWDFVGENIVVSGFNISLDAPSEYVGFPSIPIHFVPLGVLPAGTYTVSIRPIARNVTPSAVCPTVTVPLTIPQGAQNMAVPSSNGVLLALLGLLLGAMGVVAHRRSEARVSIRVNGTRWE
ncbi:MAG: hypothetical protein WBP11_05855 [Dokdonella sp.]